MSHEATNWAIKQRGIKPAAKLVLWQLADRHNKDTRRCDPDQETLAEDCEISRSSLNDQLNTLERKGFIKRFQRRKKGSNRQLNTFYILSFDSEIELDIVRAASENWTRVSVSEKSPKPCPKKAQSRVQISDTNPVREPVKNPRAFKSLNFQGLKVFDLISDAALSEAKGRWPQYDITQMQIEWADYASRRAEKIRSPDSAFLGFGKKYVEERPIR